MDRQINGWMDKQIDIEREREGERGVLLTITIKASIHKREHKFHQEKKNSKPEGMKVQGTWQVLEQVKWRSNF